MDGEKAVNRVGEKVGNRVSERERKMDWIEERE